MSDDRVLPTRRVRIEEGIDAQPAGYEEVDESAGTVGARTGGYFTAGTDADQARLRLHDAQVALASLSYLDAGQIDAPWGNTTQRAVVLFQEDHGLEVSGQLDARTYEAILAEYENGLEVESERREGEDRSDPIDPSSPLNQ